MRFDHVPELWTSLAWAQDAGAGAAPTGGSLLGFLMPLILIFVLFYVLMILPQQRQQKRHQAMLNALKKGDRVVTNGGMIGAVTNIHDDVITLQVAESVKIKVLRRSVSALRDEQKKTQESGKDSKPQITSQSSEKNKDASS